jgi:hypothetical protein
MRPVALESWLERHHLIKPDHDARLMGIAGQPFELTWPRKSGRKPAGTFPGRGAYNCSANSARSRACGVQL